jgi:hypothetical protein
MNLSKSVALCVVLGAFGDAVVYGSQFQVQFLLPPANPLPLDLLANTAASTRSSHAIPILPQV